MSNDADTKEGTSRFFIEHKLSSLHTAGNVCMTWWVSSVVFSGTILAAVWLQRVELRRSAFMMGLILGVLTLFFAGVVAFGGVVIKYLKNFEEDVIEVALRGGGRTQPLTEMEIVFCRLFRTELKFFICGMWVGTICFALILIAWICFWIGLWLRCCGV